jgi:hypothetical protein
MTTYAVTRKSDGVEVYRYSADAPIPWVGFEFATHDHTEYVELVPVVDQPVAPVRVWSRIEFLRKFTPTERITIRTVAKQNAQLDDFMFLLEAAQEVHSDNADVLAGLSMLEAAGLIGKGRAAEILNG